MAKVKKNRKKTPVTEVTAPIRHGSSVMDAMAARGHAPSLLSRNGGGAQDDVVWSRCTRCLCLGMLHVATNVVDGTAVNFDCDNDAMDKR